MIGPYRINTSGPLSEFSYEVAELLRACVREIKAETTLVSHYKTLTLSDRPHTPVERAREEVAAAKANYLKAKREKWRKKHNSLVRVPIGTLLHRFPTLPAIVTSRGWKGPRKLVHVDEHGASFAKSVNSHEMSATNAPVRLVPEDMQVVQ